MTVLKCRKGSDMEGISSYLSFQKTDLLKDSISQMWSSSDEWPAFRNAGNPGNLGGRVVKDGLWESSDAPRDAGKLLVFGEQSS